MKNIRAEVPRTSLPEVEMLSSAPGWPRAAFQNSVNMKANGTSKNTLIVHRIVVCHHFKATYESPINWYDGAASARYHTVPEQSR
jgi:hypothetical protein